MLEFYRQGKISLEMIVQKMCHNPAEIFSIRDRGYLREGYFADLVLVDLNRPWTVKKENIVAKCGWSPFEGTTFQSQITHTLVSGKLVYKEGIFDVAVKGQKLQFDR
jgi:dihydroorotase